MHREWRCIGAGSKLRPSPYRTRQGVPISPSLCSKSCATIPLQQQLCNEPPGCRTPHLVQLARRDGEPWCSGATRLHHQLIDSLPQLCLGYIAGQVPNTAAVRAVQGGRMKAKACRRRPGAARQASRHHGTTEGHPQHDSSREEERLTRRAWRVALRLG
jgi:hypothetical protein